MKVMICYPPVDRSKGVPLLSQNRQFQYFHHPTRIFPVIPATAVALLREKGHTVSFVDAIAEGHSTTDFLREVEWRAPDLLAFETKTPVVREHWKTVSLLRESFPDLRIAVMGDHAAALPEETLRNSPADFVLTAGDYDILLEALCRHLETGGRLMPGFRYRDGDAIRSTGEYAPSDELDRLPFADRETVDFRRYNREYNLKGSPFAYIMSGRDCPYHGCSFCSWRTLFPGFRQRSPENVLNEVALLIDKHGVREIFDDTGTFPKGEWREEFCRKMIERGIHRKVMFSCNCRVDYIDDVSAGLMKAAGFRLLKMGLESGNQETLDRLNKGIRVEQIRQGCETAKRSGLDVHLTMIAGYPWEDRRMAERTYALARELMLSGRTDLLQATVIVPYPGTELHEQALKNDWFRFDSKDYDRYDMREPVMKTPDMTPEEVMALTRRIYRIFLHPRYMFHRLAAVRDLHDLGFLARGARAVFGHLRDFT